MRSLVSGHLPGAVNIPHTDVAERIDELSVNNDDEIVVHCQSGKRAAIAQETLEGMGFTNIRHLDGDWAGWQAILADREEPGGSDPMAAMNLDLPSGFGTVSSSLIGLGEDTAAQDTDMQWLFAAGRPDEAPYLPVDLHG